MYTGKKINLDNLISGFIFLIVGLISFFNPKTAIRSYVFIFAILLMIRGVIGLYDYLKADKDIKDAFLKVNLIISIFNFLLGMLLLFNVKSGVTLISVFFPVWLIIDSLVKMIHLQTIRKYNPRAGGIAGLLNLMGIVFGIAMLSKPSTATTFFTYLVGIYFVVYGLINIFGTLIDFIKK